MNYGLRILLIYNGVFVFAGGLLGPLYAIYVGDIKDGILPVSISWSAFLVSATLFTFAISKLGDKVENKQYFLMAGYLIRTLSWTLYVFVSNLAALTALQILLGLGEALGTPSFNAVFAEHLDRNKHLTDYSDWKIIEQLATALAAIIGGLIVKQFGFKVLFIVMASLSLVSFWGVLINRDKLSKKKGSLFLHRP